MAHHEIQERLGAQHRRARPADDAVLPGALREGHPLPFAVSLLLVLVGVAALGWVITRQVRQHIRGEQTAALHSLLVLLWLVVVVFSAAFFQLDRVDDAQVVDLRTRLDSLYFVLSTLATVGYGDVHAVGQTARALVSVQIVLNLVFVAALVRLVLAGLSTRRPDPERSAGRGTDANGRSDPST